MRTRFQFLSAAFVAALSAAAAADTIVVPTEHATIQAAVDAAADGDTIVVKKGRYTENVLVDGNAGKNNLTIKGVGKPVVDGGGTGNGLTIANATGIVVTRMSFTKARVNGLLVQGSSNIEISKCSAFDNSNTDNVLGSGMRIETSDNVTIEKSKISNNGVFAIWLFDPTGVALTACTLDKNTITGGEQGISVQGTDHVVMRNKITGNSRIAIFLDDESTNVRFEKNSVKDSADEALLAVGGSGHHFVNNKYVKTRSVGVFVDGDDVTMDGEKVIKSSDTGVQFSADNSTLRGVKVVGSGEHGIDVSGTGSLIEGCTVIRTKDDAFKARRPGGNTFRNNKARKSRNRDLDDDTDGATTYEGNKFDASKVSPDGTAF